LLSLMIMMIRLATVVGEEETESPSCPSPTDPCMNQDNYQKCQSLINDMQCTQLLVMESCPLQFACGDNDE
jgi:hypothetical protein